MMTEDEVRERLKCLEVRAGQLAFHSLKGLYEEDPTYYQYHLA